MAEKEKGYVCLFRSIQENLLWDNDEPFDRRSAFVDLILLANFKEKEMILHGGKKKTIKRGQFHTSIGNLAQRWKWSKNKVRRYLVLLSELDMVHTVGTARGTTVTIVNYGKFQDVRRTNGTPDETSNGTSDGTTDGTPDGTRLKNVKNVKKEKKKAAPSSFYSDRPRWHIEGEYEFWLDDDGCWHRALIGQKEEE